MLLCSLFPLYASADVFSLFGASAQADAVPLDSSVTGAANSQQMDIVSDSSIGPSSLSSDDSSSSDIVITDAALTPSMGPVGTPSDVADLPPSDGGDISTYTVQAGDTIHSVATMFGVTDATIVEANNLTIKQKLKAGDELTILPFSGHLYVVAKGDTLKTIAKKYPKVDVNDIAFYNGMSLDDGLAVGDTLVIPDSDFTIATHTAKSTTSSILKTALSRVFAVDPNTPDPIGDMLLRPILGGIRTQGLHANCHCAVDIATPIGTPIRAAYDGTIIVADNSGYNGGYGRYVAISHVIDGVPVTTKYGHMSHVEVSVGQTVSRGEVIGLSGNTGLSTGPHVHFEVIGKGVVNPIALDPDYGL